MGSTGAAMPMPFPSLGSRALLHQGRHLDPHHSPHASHSYAVLCCVLVVVHVAALGFWAWLAYRSLAPKQSRKPRRGAELKPLQCKQDWPSHSSKQLL